MSKPAKNEKEKNQHIQVYVRCRPLNGKEKRQGSFGVVETGDRDVHVKDRTVPTAPTKTFSFDKVYGPHSKQIEVYKQVVSPIVDEVLSGYNCTVFAYGQTGTGKTFTMEGERTQERNVSWEDDPLAGIIPRAMHQLFTRLNMMEKTKGCEFSVRVSFLEIYNEELIDLLGAESMENPRLRIYEDSTRKGSCIIQGLEEVVVRNKDEIYKIMDQGSARRQTAATLMNAHSSRSHSLFMVTIHIKENSVDGEEMMKTGKLNLVDLAGSECIGRSGAVEKRAREAGNINQSLLTLGRVITALVEHAPHVPYRESKLTRLLQDSLGGRTKTSIIATISPASCNLDETLSTLDYAFRAKNITNRPEINQRLSKKTYLKECNEEIERLRRDLQAARDKNGVYLAQENYDEMQTKIQQQKDSILDLTDRIALVTAEMFKVTELFEETKEELADTETKLTETRDTLSHTSDVLDRTRLNYQVTIQDRDEQRYLVSQHVATEKKLSSQATQLLTTSNEASSDVSGLHAKLERKTKVEEHNQSAIETFRLSFRENIDSMKASLTNFSDGQIKSSSEIKSSLGAMVDRRTSEVSQLCSGLGEMVDTLKSRIERLEEEETAHMANSQEWAASFKKHCQQNKEGEVNRQGDFHERTFLSSMMEIQCALKQHVTSLQELASIHTSQMETQQARFANFVTEMQSRLHAEADMAKSLTKTMETNLSQRQQEMQHTVESQNTHNKELADKLAANVSQLIQEMITSQQSHLVANTGKVQQGHDSMLNQVQTFGTSAASHIGAAVSFSDQGLTDLNQLTSEHDATVQDAVKQQCTTLENVMEQQNSLKAHVSSFTQQTTETCTSQTNQILEMVEEHTAALSIARSAHKEGIELATSQCSSTVDQLKQEQTSQQTVLTSDVRAQQGQLDVLSNEVSDWSKGMLEALEDRDAHVEKLVTDETKKDLPTGSTPKPREFSYPRSLARTNRHSEIVQDFRRSYVLREVTDLPIPNTSFESVASEVSPLDLDADLEEYDQNVSGDSAFSTASAVSSIATSDQPDLDDVSSTSTIVTDKENSMKPPKTKNVVKNQRTTLHRSRSRSGKETPTPKKSGSTSKTPSSQRQSRTRLPLRTSNPVN